MVNYSGINVVIRYIDVFKKWYICFASDYKTSFRSSVNGFTSREDAVSFAESYKCIVVFHDDDPLQTHE